MQRGPGSWVRRWWHTQGPLPLPSDPCLPPPLPLRPPPPSSLPPSPPFALLSSPLPSPVSPICSPLLSSPPSLPPSPHSPALSGAESWWVSPASSCGTTAGLESIMVWRHASMEEVMATRMPAALTMSAATWVASTFTLAWAGGGGEEGGEDGAQGDDGGEGGGQAGVGGWLVGGVRVVMRVNWASDCGERVSDPAAVVAAATRWLWL